MRAQINKEGVLILSDETETENYAIQCWLETIPELRIIDNGIGSIAYNIPAPPNANPNNNDDLPF